MIRSSSVRMRAHTRKSIVQITTAAPRDTHTHKILKKFYQCLRGCSEEEHEPILALTKASCQEKQTNVPLPYSLVEQVSKNQNVYFEELRGPLAGTYSVLWNRRLEIIRSAVDLLQAVGTLYKTDILRRALTSTSWGSDESGSQKKIK